MTDTIGALLRGSIDMHCHHGPDATFERRADALEIALMAQEAGMRAIVIKSHQYPTAPLASIIRHSVQDIAVFGGIALDMEVGGLNVHALETSAKLGAKVVWMPTSTSAHDMRQRGAAGEGISLFDSGGKLLPVIDELLEIIKAHRMVLATGHISPAEAFALVDEAVSKGIDKIVATHPLNERHCYLTLEEQRKMAGKGAFIEHCFVDTTPFHGRIDPALIVQAVKAVGAERCIFSTDLGQAWNPAPAEGMRVMIATMLGKRGVPGLTEKELELLVKVNPARLLDLD